MNTFSSFRNAPPEVKRNVLRRIAQMAVFDILFALILFGAAGSARWFFGWLFIGLMVVMHLTAAFFTPLELIAERGSAGKANVELWDRVLTSILLLTFIASYLVAGFDFRHHWSAPIAAAWQVLAVLVFLLGCALEYWAVSANRFFSTNVRLQTDRGHVVCSSGPYRYLRHPGYAGIILYSLATPVFLGSWWAFLPAFAGAALFVLRTALEDRTLQLKLPGYKEYAQRVRYRLLPGVW